MPISGAGTNLKVGGARPAQSTGKICLSCPPLFALQVQLVVYLVLVSAFVIVSTVWSVACLLFFYSRSRGAPRAQPFVKAGTRTAL